MVGSLGDRAGRRPGLGLARLGQARPSKLATARTATCVQAAKSIVRDPSRARSSQAEPSRAGLVVKACPWAAERRYDRSGPWTGFRSLLA